MRVEKVGASTIEGSGGSEGGVLRRKRVAIPRWRDLLHGSLGARVVEDLLGAAEDGVQGRRVGLRGGQGGVRGRRVVRRGARLCFVWVLVGVFCAVDGGAVALSLLPQRLLVFSAIFTIFLFYTSLLLNNNNNKLLCVMSSTLELFTIRFEN